jgi:copper chaperone
MIYKYYKNRPHSSLTLPKGVVRVNINISDRTVNAFYDSQITDAHVIRMTLLKEGYKIITKPVKAL